MWYRRIGRGCTGGYASYSRWDGLLHVGFHLKIYHYFITSISDAGSVVKHDSFPIRMSMDEEYVENYIATILPRADDCQVDLRTSQARSEDVDEGIFESIRHKGNHAAWQPRPVLVLS